MRLIEDNSLGSFLYLPWMRNKGHCERKLHSASLNTSQGYEKRTWPSEDILYVEQQDGKINIIVFLLSFWLKLETDGHNMHSFLQNFEFGLLASSGWIVTSHHLKLNKYFASLTQCNLELTYDTGERALVQKFRPESHPEERMSKIWADWCDIARNRCLFRRGSSLLSSTTKDCIKPSLWHLLKRRWGRDVGLV